MTDVTATTRPADVDAMLCRDFVAVPGRIYELRIALRHKTLRHRLNPTTVNVDYFDGSERRIDPGIVGPDLLLPYLDPVEIETLPADVTGEIAHDAGISTRLVPAPPYSRRVTVTIRDTNVEVLHIEFSPLGVPWASSGAAFLRETRALVAARTRLLDRLVPRDKSETGHGTRARAMVADVPMAQVKALNAQFARAEGWADALKMCDAAAETAELGARIASLRAGAARALRVAFIGSARGCRRLGAHADVFFLRQASWRADLVALGLDAIVVETGAESRPGDWRGAFTSLDGTLPEAGRELCERALALEIPLRLFVTCEEAEMPFWRDLVARADAVVIEGNEEGWRAPADGAMFVRPAAEPTVTPPIRKSERAATTLVPVGSDVFQYPAFAALLRQRACSEILVTEFDYGIVPAALADRLGTAPHRATSLVSFSQRTRLLQESNLVLVSGETLRSAGQMAAILLDAISCGAIPVVFGAGRATDALGLNLDRVWSADELQSLERLYRIPWYRELRWRSLWRDLSAHHVWTSDERAALFDADPAAPDLDAPEITAIMVSKRPKRIEDCLATFRQQTHPNRDLILVLNVDETPELPPLRPNERIVTVPQSWNIGRCLNSAIAEARGRYWAKMDDDDYYSRHYIEELAQAFRASQASIVGRQAIYFYFEGHDQTVARTQFLDRTLSILRDKQYVSGATLAASAADAIGFLGTIRNAADSQWVQRSRISGQDIYCFDSTSMVVHRDRDDSVHTWRMARQTHLRAAQFTSNFPSNVGVIFDG